MTRRSLPASGVRVPSFAKINLGLEVVGPRSDGFTEIVTLYQTIGLCDDLTFRPGNAGGISVTCSDRTVPCDGRNLVVRAYEALRQESGPLPGIEVSIRKRIPPGGGLGGGSGNAAVTLLVLDRLLGLGLSRVRLAELAEGIGSDVPLFLVGGLILGLGRGELLAPLPDLRRHHVVLALPGAAVSTAEVFSRVRRARKGRSHALTASRAGTTIFNFLLDTEDPEGIARLGNDLSPGARPLVLGYDEMVSRLRGSGALLSLLSGSGSTVFGLYRTREEAKSACRALGKVRGEVTYTVGRREYQERILGPFGAEHPRSHRATRRYHHI